MFKNLRFRVIANTQRCEFPEGFESLGAADG
jgi:hypothetical protein